MSIEKRQALAIANVLADQRLQQSRFSGAGPSHDVHVETPVVAPDAKEAPVVPKIDSGEICDLSVHHQILKSRRGMQKMGELGRAGQFHSLGRS